MVEIIWTDGDTFVRNPPEVVKDALSYWHRALVQDNNSWNKKVKNERVLLYQKVVGEENTIVTFQGFADVIVNACKKHGIQSQFYDRRTPFPGPQLKFVKGFRGSQLGMFLQLLHANRSGLLQAPTRFGKTQFLINIMRAFPGLKTVLAAPGVNLLAQLQKELQEALPGREITGIYTGSKGKKESDDITVCSLDSLEKIDADATRLLLIDEPHAAVSPTRTTILARFKNARIYGFGATLAGRFDGADKLITGLIGPVLVKKTFQEAVAEGAICPIRVFMVRMPFTPFKVGTRDHAYRALIYKNQDFFQIVREIAGQVIPEEWQTLIFIDEIKQAELMEFMVANGTTAIASKMSNAERKEKFRGMVANEIKRMIATDIYAQGVTFPQLRVIVNAAGGGGSITSTQKPGRLAQKQPGKEAGYMIDFLWEPISTRGAHEGPEMPGKFDQWTHVVRDSNARLETYRKNGYDVRIVNSLAEIQLGKPAAVMV